MKPYKSGPYLVGNRFLLNLKTGRIRFHCRRTMEIIASRLAPDEASYQDDGDETTEEERLVSWMPYIMAALEKEAPSQGCEKSRENPFWGTSGEEGYQEEIEEQVDIAEWVEWERPIAEFIEHAVKVGQPQMVRRYDPEPKPSDCSRQYEKPKQKSWTPADEELYQISKFYEGYGNC